MLNNISEHLYSEKVLELEPNQKILNDRKTIHETSFSFRKDSSKDLSIEDIKFHLYCDASTLDRNIYSTPIEIDKPNSIIAGIIKYKNIDYVCYKKNILCDDNNMAELLAIQEGLHIANNLKLKHINIYTDSSVSITFIKKHIENHKSYFKNVKFIPVTADIINSLKNFDTCNFVHVPRKENKQADKLTKYKRSLLIK